MGAVLACFFASTVTLNPLLIRDLLSDALSPADRRDKLRDLPKKGSGREGRRVQRQPGARAGGALSERREAPLAAG
jgi:hypothetical protein